MANINTGAPIRFENGGVVKVGGSSDVVLNIVAGTLNWKVMGREVIAHKDRGTLGSLVAGDQRPCEVSLDVYYTANYETSGSLLLLVEQTISSGVVSTFDIVVDMPDNLGASSGTRWTFGECYLPDGYEVQTSEGATFDRLILRCLDNELEPTIANY
jgi:hypothetical protein